MAEPYRIWLRRSDTHNRIVDEDIWVGNVPGDGKSKISSGYTQHSEEWAYVEFATWEDLLKAIGEEEETVQVLVTGQFEQIDNGEPPTPSLSISAPSTVAASGGTLTVVITSNTGWTLSTNVGSISPTSGSGDRNDVRLTVPENTGTGTRTITVTATGGGLTRTATITQSGATPPPPTPTYSLTVSAATGYDTTIDSTGTTKLVAVYSDGLGGNTAVTTSATWEVTSGQSYISVNNSGSNKGTVTGLDANDSQVTCKVKATFNGYEGTANITVRAKAGPTTHDIILDSVKFLVQHMGSNPVDSVKFVSFRLYSPTAGATTGSKTFTNITEDASGSTSWDVTRFTVNNGDAVRGKLTININPESHTTLEHAGFVGNGSTNWLGGTLNTDESDTQNGKYVYDYYVVGDAVTTDVTFPDVVVKIDARNSGGQPTYSLVVNVANGYSSTIDSTGTTQLVATYYDGLGGSTGVTDQCDWLVTSGAGYVNIITTTNPITVNGRGNATSIDQKSKVMARFNGLSDEIIITILQDPVIPPYISLDDPDDMTYFMGIPCTGLPSPGHTVVIDTNIAWKARLSDIDDAYWLHMSYDQNGVTVYIEQNTDPYSGEGGSSRGSSFIIEAVDSTLGVPSITINVSQESCDDLINIPNRDPFVFTCDGASSFTRNVEAWDDVQWHIVPVFGEWETPGWFSVSPTSGIGDGSFTVTILRDNYDNAVRGSGYLQIYTGSTQTYLDWDINVRQEPTPFFDVSGNSIHAASEGGNVSVTVYTNQPITASTTASWIKNLSIGNNVRVVGGTAYTIVTFTIEENTSVDQRDGNVTIGSTYSGPCGNFESENVQVLQDGADTDSATFIQVKKYEEPITAFRQEIEYPIQEADASTTAVTFNIWSDGKCKLTDISSATGHDGLRVVMVNGAVELDVTDGTPFDGTGVFKAIYGQAYIGHEKNFKITFEVSDPGIITTASERATVEITQERDYPIGVTGVTIDNVGPHVVPNTTDGPGNCCAWHLTEMWVQIYAETIYKSGYRTHSAEAINNYIKTQGNLAGVDSDILTLEVLNNPSTGTKYCLILPDELQDPDGYHSTYDFPYQIQFSPNTGTTTTTDPWADGFRRDVQFRLTYQDDDGNFAQEDFTVRVPYCNPAAPGTQEVYINSGNTPVDEVDLYPGVNTHYDIPLSGLTVGETKIHFYGWGESLSDTLIDSFQIQYEYFDVTDGTNEYVAELSSPMLSFTVLSTDEFGIEIECTRQGYSPKSLYIYFNREP